MKRAAEAGLLAVAVAAGVVSGVTLAHEHAPGPAASYSGSPLPARFTASDGAVYHQLAVTSLTVPAQKYARLTIHVGSEPVAVVMGACDSPAAEVTISFKVENGDNGLIACRPTPQVVGLSVRPGQTAVITFVQASRLNEPDFRGRWQLAAYEWKPPATVRPAPAAPRLPQSYTGPNTTAGHGNVLRKLVAGRSGIWPGDRTATFTLTFHGHRSYDISTVCAGAIGGQLQVSHQIVDHHGEGSWSEADPCTPAGPGELEQAGTISGANGLRITLNYRIQAPSAYFAADYAKRPASWTIAIYEEQS